MMKMLVIGMCMTLLSIHSVCAQNESTITKIITINKKVIIGQITNEVDNNIVLLDLNTSKETTIKRDDIRSYDQIEENEILNYIEVPKLLAWHITRLIPRDMPIYHIAKLDLGVIYITSGIESGITSGQEMRVYRSQSEIIDPISNKVIGAERRFVAKLAITEVFSTFAKAKVCGDLEPDLKVGDFVEPIQSINSLAILPFVNNVNEQICDGDRFADRLITSLSEYNMTVIERARLYKVINELMIQNTAIFDIDRVQRIGKQLGARAIVVGVITSKKPSYTVSARLVEVETGKILFSHEYQILNMSKNKWIVDDDTSVVSEHKMQSSMFRQVLKTIKVKSPSFFSKEAPQIIIDGKLIHHDREPWLRGLFVVAIVDNKIVLHQLYDILGYANLADKFAEDIRKLPNGAIVILVVGDDATLNFNQNAQKAIISIGGKIGLLGKPIRSTYYCIGQKGLRSGAAIEKIGQDNLYYPPQ